MNRPDYEDFVRRRITELRVQKDISEHRMSLELGKSGSYIRSISSGAALPSLREFFNILEYFELTPDAFFATMTDEDSHRLRMAERVRMLDDDTLDKLELFLGWIT